MSALPFQGGGHFQDFRPGFGFWHICHVDRHGHFTLKQLRLPVVNETHTKSYTGPRLLISLLNEQLSHNHHSLSIRTDKTYINFKSLTNV
jgi:hypothetical protein